jgi:hypothetical protein
MLLQGARGNEATREGAPNKAQAPRDTPAHDKPRRTIQYPPGDKKKFA